VGAAKNETSSGAKSAAGSQAVTINNTKEETFDMETGQSRPAAAKFEAIAEGDEDE